MIFKSLFRPKYLDPNPEVRRKAIASLSPSDAEQKTQLHELAFNDEDANVSLAALEKLNSFPLWCKMAEIAKQERVRKKASQIVENALLDQGPLSINKDDKYTFLKECKNNGLLETLLKKDGLENQPTELVLDILKRLDKPHLTWQLFFKFENQDIQLALIEQFEDESTLAKICKKSVNPDVINKAQQCLSYIAEMKLLPQTLEKKVPLLLSRLLALKEKVDVIEITTLRGIIEAEYSELVGQFHHLTVAKREEYESKYQQISQKIDSHLAVLTPDWKRQQQRLEQVEDAEQIEQQFIELNQKLANDLEQDASRITLGQVEEFENQLQIVKNELHALTLTVDSSFAELHKKLESLYNNINSCKSTLESLPEFQQTIDSAKAFLKAFELLPLPTDYSQLDASYQYLSEQKSAWQDFQRAYQAQWPKNLNKQWHELSQGWQRALREIKNNVQKDQERCRAKLRVVDSLVNQGRFKAAISLFGRVDKWYKELPEKSQTGLQRSFNKVLERIENLQDWQQYIAEPRKPELLKEAEKLITVELSIEQRTAEIKKLRNQWNSLGKTHSESDNALNDTFETVLEAAFEPCRLYFAEKDRQREANLLIKQSVLQKLNGLADSGLKGQELVDKYRDLQQQWRDAKEIDFKQLEHINSQYRQAVAKITPVIDDFYQLSIEQKQKLIDQSNQLLNLQDTTEAVQQAKINQARWKDIPATTHKQDAKLWREFRKANDQIFAQRKQQYEQQKQETNDVVSQLETLLKQMQERLSNVTHLSEIDSIFETQMDVEQLMEQLPGKLVGKYKKSLDKVFEKRQKTKEKLKHKQAQQQIEGVFEALRAWQGDVLPEQVEVIPPQWKSCFVTGTDHVNTRQQLVIKMEIQADKESPSEQLEARKAIQLQMMADKLQGNNLPSLEDMFKAWIKQGPLSSEDVEMLKRIEKVYSSTS